MLCTNIVLNFNTKKNNFCTQHVLNLYFWGNSMNNLLSYCWLTDARMRASEQDLPVCIIHVQKYKLHMNLENISTLKIQNPYGGAGMSA